MGGATCTHLCNEKVNFLRERRAALVTMNYILRWVQARPTKGRPGSEAGSSSTDEPIYLLL